MAVEISRVEVVVLGLDLVFAGHYATRARTCYVIRFKSNQHLPFLIGPAIPLANGSAGSRLCVRDEPRMHSSS